MKKIFCLSFFILFVSTFSFAQNFGFSNSPGGNLFLYSEEEELVEEPSYIRYDQLLYNYASEFKNEQGEEFNALNFDLIYNRAIDSISGPFGSYRQVFASDIPSSQDVFSFGIKMEDSILKFDSLMSVSPLAQGVYQALISDVEQNPDAYNRLGKKVTERFIEHTISNEEVVINADTKNKSISGSASTRISLSDKLELKNLGGLIGISTFVKAEKDFANIFEGGEISSTGGISGTLGFGNIPKRSTLKKDNTIENKINKLYWLVFASVNADFVKIANVMQPEISLEKNTIKDQHWGGRFGINGYFPKLDLTTGITYTFGTTNNISQLTKQKLTTTITSATDSTLTIIKQDDVLTGGYREIGFNNLSFDALYSPNYFKSIALFLNFNYNKFKDLPMGDDISYNFNFGLLFRKKDKDTNAYKPAFGFVMGWNNLWDDTKTKNLNFGITTTYGFGSFNKAKVPKSEVQD